MAFQMILELVRAARQATAKAAGRNQESADPRKDRLFTAENSHKGVFRSKRGAELPLPYHCYDADALVIYGTAGRDALTALVEGAGYHPVEVGDQGKGIVRLWVVNYKDTNLGPYKELVITIDASRERKRVAYRNVYSIMLPGLDPSNALFVYRLLLPNNAEVPIDYGREVFGFDKRRATRIDIDRITGGRWPVKTFGFYGNPSGAEGLGEGKLILSGSVVENDGFVAKLRSGAGLLAALGPQKMRELLKTEVLSVDTIALDVESPSPHAKLKRTPLLVQGTPRLNRWDGRNSIQWGRETELGRELEGMQYQALLCYRVPHLRFVMKDTAIESRDGADRRSTEK